MSCEFAQKSRLFVVSEICAASIDMLIQLSRAKRDTQVLQDCLTASLEGDVQRQTLRMIVVF